MDAVNRILNFFQRRQRDFQLVFSRTSPASQNVLAELMHYCYANRPFPMNAEDIKRYEGRRDVWNFINRSINLTPDEQYDLASKKDKP